MTNREWLILDALNVASTIHWDQLGYGATAAQIVDVIGLDERMIADYTAELRDLNARQVAKHLGEMAKGPPTRRAPLVQCVRPGSTRWRHSEAGLEVAVA